MKSDKALKIKLWKLCREIALILYDSKHCYTCGRKIEGQGRQLGHFIPSSTCGASLRWDLQNLRWQCYYCNINLGGNGAAFYRKMVLEVGQEKIDEIFKRKEQITKLNRRFLENKIADYEAWLEDVKGLSTD